MKNFNKLTRLHQKISQLENSGKFIESKKLHAKFVKEAAMPVYPYMYPVQYQQYPQYSGYQYPVQYQQYPAQYSAQYQARPVAYPQVQQQMPVQQVNQQQPTKPQTPTPQTTTQPPAGQPNIQPNAFYYDNKTKQYYYKGKPVSQMSDTEIKKMQEEMFKK